MYTMEQVCKEIHDMQEAVKNAHAGLEKAVEDKVAAQLKLILADNPGFTPERKIKFGDDKLVEGITQDDMLQQVPKELQAEMDNIYLASKILGRNPRELKRYRGFRKMFESKAGDFAKALDTTTAGGVDEWVPTEMSPEFREKIRLNLKVAALFPTVAMPSNPYELPVELGNINSFKSAEVTADSGGTEIPKGDDATISGKTTFTAVGHKTMVLTSVEATEDSINPILPFLNNRMALALAQGREDAILNGDTNATHEDSDTTSATSRRKLFLGLRAHGNDQSYTRDLSTLTAATLLDLISDAGVYGISPANTAFVTGIRGYILMMKMGDEVMTVDKFGPNAVVLQGQLANVLGRPIIVSEYVRADLNSSAVYASGSTRTIIHLVNRDGLAIGERRRPTSQLLVERYAEMDQRALIVTERIDFEPLFTIASNKVLYNGINVG